MASKGKGINQNNTFLARFIEQHMKKERTLEELGLEFGASRQTVANWFSGDSIPGIDALVKMAQFYNVSADYLLGLSDAASVDVNVKAAMEYTGLSEAAVESLHGGLDDCDLSDKGKKQNLDTASALIQNKSFIKMISSIKEILEAAYWEETFRIVKDQYLRPDMSKEDREVVVENLVEYRNLCAVVPDNLMRDRLRTCEYIEIECLPDVYWRGTKGSNEHHQFHAAKAFNRYIDQVVEASCKRARERFEK